MDWGVVWTVILILWASSLSGRKKNGKWRQR